MQAPATVRSFCRNLLESGDLASKLAPPRGPGGETLCDDEPGEPLLIDAPARSGSLTLREGTDPLPHPGQIVDAAARARCLARFAHHELMAAELFAWALLRWPDLPAALRHGWLSALAEEQQHCRLYLERLHALGSDLGDHRLSGYFWKQAPAIAASPHGPRAFLCAMGLTLEQANLDFSLLYRDLFRAAGDEASAEVCQRVHDDEVKHVRLAASWLRRLAEMDGEPGRTDLDLYREAVPFPMSPARAKGRRFEAEPRRRAGLSEAFIEHVRSARARSRRRRRPAP